MRGGPKARAIVASAACACLVMLSQTLTDAWGYGGHVAIARVAMPRLDPGVPEAIRELLEPQRMDDQSVVLWADRVRETTHPFSYNWHFVDIPIGTSGYSAARDCEETEKGDCIIRALDRHEATLRSAAATKTARREALKFVIHFVGDLHQPLHCADNDDRGGGARTIAPIGGSTTLHAAWDSGIFTASSKSAAALVSEAESWLASQDEDEIARGSYRSWAAESFAIGRDVAYAQVTGDNRISTAERKLALGFAERQLGKGGVRLAAVLNRTLDTQ